MYKTWSKVQRIKIHSPKYCSCSLLGSNHHLTVTITTFLSYKIHLIHCHSLFQHLLSTVSAISKLAAGAVRNGDSRSSTNSSVEMADNSVCRAGSTNKGEVTA